MDQNAALFGGKRGFLTRILLALSADLGVLMSDSAPDWHHKKLAELNEQEWEALCDGCGRCCLQKLQDTDSGMTFFTRVACRLLDLDSCRCSDYDNRLQKVPDCTQVAPLTPQKIAWLPASCAYRKVDNGEPLATWHPLCSGHQDSVHQAGKSVREWAISECVVDDSQYEDLLIEFDDDDNPVPL